MTLLPYSRRAEDKSLTLAVTGVSQMQKTIIDLRQQLEASQARVAELEQAAQWRDIAEAPRDGTRILLGRTESEDHAELSTTGHWEDAQPDGPDEMGYDAGFVDEDYCDFILGRHIGNPKYFREEVQPTHWLPLPAPPSAGKEVL